ncbi:hypothetical protein N9189_02290 [Pirellulaceae bacterium]|jgi:hypothetical protein|nr:hypothetical protein [Pirellulaceae bacterium]
MAQSSQSKVLERHILNNNILVIIFLTLMCCRTMQADDSSFFEFMLAIRLIDDPLVYEELRISKTQREELAEKIRAIKKTHLDWKGA